MASLGTPAPAFRLPDVATGESLSLESFAGAKALLVAFICRHCPYVVHVKAELARLARDYHGRGVAFVGISANDAERYPEDAPERLAEFAHELGFPVLYDEEQDVAKAYEAACTPDFFLFNAERKLVYRGQLDASRPGNARTPDGRDLRRALDAVLTGLPVPGDQRASIGCSIKWKPGNEPAPTR